MSLPVRECPRCNDWAWGWQSSPFASYLTWMLGRYPATKISAFVIAAPVMVALGIVLVNCKPAG